MEKITLKPVVKELLHKTDEVNSHFDVLTYSGSNTQERMLGSLYLIGHAKFDEDEDLAYVISLVSSLAKREYYSETSVNGQDPKKAFENTLKKLNEVLQDFFKNKSLQLNIGLTAVAGDQIYISKLGKFKVALARNGEHIDVLNNIALFQKSPENEQQFSNVISGKLQPGDKLFAFYPTRSLTSREKMLQGLLVKDSQDMFMEKIGQLASATDSFSCCGIHLAMEQIKEIPIEHPSPTATLASNTNIPTITMPPTPDKPRVIAAELSLAKKRNVFTSISTAAHQLKGMQNHSLRSRFRSFSFIAIIVLIPLFGIIIYRASGDSSEVKAAFRQASENAKIIETKIALGEAREARSLIAQTFALIQPFDDEKIITIKGNLASSLDTLDKVSTIVPQKITTITDEIQSTVLAIQDGKVVASYNNAELLMVNDKAYTLKDPVSATDATLYENNLYTLAGGQIYKYADALAGGTTRTSWGTPDVRIHSIAVDGNLFGLTDDGNIIMYFKGDKKTEFTTNLPTNNQSQLATATDGELIYISNPETKRLYAIDKTNGSLQATYKLDVLGELKDTTVARDGSVWLLSKDNQIWQITGVPL